MSALTGLLNAQKQQAQGLRKHEQLKLKEQQLALQKQQEEVNVVVQWLYFVYLRVLFHM